MITAEHIRAARAVLKMGQREFATATGLNTNTVVRIENGAEFKRETERRIAEYLVSRGLVAGDRGISWSQLAAADPA